jgi:hypothetical protein
MHLHFASGDAGSRSTRVTLAPAKKRCYRAWTCTQHKYYQYMLFVSIPQQRHIWDVLAK